MGGININIVRKILAEESDINSFTQDQKGQLINWYSEEVEKH